MVRRFIEEKNVRGGQEKCGEEEAHFPSSREGSAKRAEGIVPKTQSFEYFPRQGGKDVPIAKSEFLDGMVVSLQENSPLLLGIGGEMRDVIFERGEMFLYLGDARTLLQKIEYAPFSQLDHVLWKIPQGESLGDLHSSVIRRDETEYAAKKCGFSGSVVADKTEAASRGNRPIESREDAVLAKGQRKSGDADHGMPPFCRMRRIRGKTD
jgi:hypothetical protein